MVPYATVREHLRYGFGDAEDLIKEYVANACDYMESITNRVFCSSQPAGFHEDPDTGSLTQVPSSIGGTVKVFMDEWDIDKVHKLHGVTGDYTVANETILYLNDQNNWVSMATEGNGVDFTKVHNIVDTYPPIIDWTGAGKPNDLNERGHNVFQVTFSGGDNVRDLPRQYRQAMLLLVGHYDMHREAETVGAVSAEIKEGVHRLLNSVRQY